MARFEWTQISMENFDTDVKALLLKLKACLDDVDGKEERDGKFHTYMYVALFLRSVLCSLCNKYHLLQLGDL